MRFVEQQSHTNNKLIDLLERMGKKMDQNIQEMNLNMKKLLKNPPKMQDVSIMHYHIYDKISDFFLADGNSYR